MPCNTLTLVDDTFGPPIEETAAGATTVRGEWKGLTLAVRSGSGGQFSYATSPQTYDVAGVSVIVNPPVPSGNVLVTIPSIGASVSLPWRSQFPGATNLTAARFRAPADMLVIRDQAPSVGIPDYSATFYVFDLRVGSTVPVQPVILGPFSGIPSTKEIQFCPSTNGHLVLIWHGLGDITTVAGRRCIVRRTLVSSAQQPDLLTAMDPNATGTIGCEVVAGTRTATIFDGAFRQGNVAVSRLPGSRNLESNSLLGAGRLALSKQSVRISAAQPSGSFEITNTGGDYLEITGISTTPVRQTVTPSIALPKCLWPGETIPVAITRASPGADAFTVTVAASPAASPVAAGTVSVTLDAAAIDPPRPAVTLIQSALSWRQGDPRPVQRITLFNSGNVPVSVQVPANTAGPFTWPDFPATTIAPGSGVVTVADVTFRPAGTAVVNGSLTITATVVGTGSPVPGFPKAVPLAGNVVAKVPVGSLRIVSVVADPPGDDMLPEGEFIVIQNVTMSALDLTGSSVLHTQFNSAGAPSGSAPLIAFGDRVFGSDALLPAGQSLRILTRGRNAAAGDPVASSSRVYAGARGAAWNNTGDTATIQNEFAEEVARYTFVTQYPSGGQPPLPPNVVVQPPAARSRILTRRIFINAQSEATSCCVVQDGDVVVIRNVTGTPHFGGFLGSAGSWGPNGKVGDLAPSTPERPDPFGPEVTWPLPDAAKFSLLGQLGNRAPFLVGMGTTLTVNFLNRPTPLTFSVNDCWLIDNNGFFDCVVDLYR